MNEILSNPWVIGIATGLISSALYGIIRDGDVEAGQVVLRFIGFGLAGVFALLVYHGSVGALLTRTLTPIAGEGAPVAAACIFGILLIGIVVGTSNDQR